MVEVKEQVDLVYEGRISNSISISYLTSNTAKLKKKHILFMCESKTNFMLHDTQN